MSFLSEVESIGTKVETFITTLIKGASTLQKIWGALSGPTLAAAAAVFYDVVTTLGDAESAASSVASGNIPNAITLSETTISAVKQIVADFKAGEATIKADFDALGIKI